MAKLRSRRPNIDTESFIAAAEGPSALSGGRLAESQPTMIVTQSQRRGEGRGDVPPWAAPGVRSDVTKLYNLRLPEPLKLKLDFIRQETRVSVHEFIMNALVPAVEAEINHLMRKEKRN